MKTNMKTNMHLTSAVLMTVLAVCIAAGSATARSSGSDTGTTTSAAKGADLSTGSIEEGAPQARQKRFEDCMSIWEPATHMTKQQWRRTCNNAFGCHDGVSENCGAAKQCQGQRQRQTTVRTFTH